MPRLLLVAAMGSELVVQSMQAQLASPWRGPGVMVAGEAEGGTCVGVRACVHVCVCACVFVSVCVAVCAWGCVCV